MAFEIEQKKIEDEIQLDEFFLALWQGKFKTLSFTLFLATVAFIYSLTLPDIYKSEALLAPTQTASSSNQSMQGYSQIAGLVGLNFNNSPAQNKTLESIEIMKSYSFFKDSILPNIFLPDLIALETWDSGSDKIDYVEGIYNINNETWENKPTTQSSFKAFSKIMAITSDSKTGFILLSAESKSPYIAKEWVEIIFTEINELQRARSREEYESAINFLSSQLAKTNFAETKQALANLLQDQISKLALVEANKNYVFKYLYPPVAREQKEKPNRFLITLIGAFLGAFFGILLSVVAYFKKSKSQ